MKRKYLTIHGDPELGAVNAITEALLPVIGSDALVRRTKAGIVVYQENYIVKGRLRRAGKWLD